jgi:putative transposase
MKLEVSLAEVIEAFKEIQEIKKQPGKILEMVKTEVPKVTGDYLSEIMQVELTRFLGRQPYEIVEAEETNHRNGSYPRSITLKKIGEVKVPRDRHGKYQTQVLPKSKQYEDEIRQDIAMMFLGGISTRTLAMMSHRLIGLKYLPGKSAGAAGNL